MILCAISVEQPEMRAERSGHQVRRLGGWFSAAPWMLMNSQYKPTAKLTKPNAHPRRNACRPRSAAKLARASTAGTFKVIPPTASEFYFPDVGGRGAGSVFEVKP